MKFRFFLLPLFILGLSFSALSQSTVNKVLYLSDGQILDRIDPVAADDANTKQTINLFKNSATLVTTATSTVNNGAISSPLAVSYTVANGTDRLLLVGIGYLVNGTNAVTSVTFGTAQLTRLSQTVNVGSNVELWYLKNPTEQTANVTVNWTGTLELVFGVANFINVNLNDPFGPVTNKAQTVLSPFSMDVASNQGDIIVDIVAKNNNSPIIGTGQTAIFNQGTNSIKIASSYKAGAVGSTNMSWTASGQSSNWAGIGVAIKGFANSDAFFAQTPTFCKPFTIKAGQTITIKAFASITSGSISNPAYITAELGYNNGNTLLLTDYTADYVSATGELTWTGTLDSDVTIPSGEAITLQIVNDLVNTTFRIEYDSKTKPSRIILPTTTYIDVTSAGVYSAAYPGGSLITSAPAGQTVYVRAVADDPFGAYDITGGSVKFINPLNAVTTFTATEVASTTCSKTYEYAWTLPASPAGTYTVRSIANEGSEGIKDSLDTEFTLSAPGLSLTKTLTSPAAGPYQINDNLTYTIVAENTGNSAITSIPLEDLFDSNCLEYVSASTAPNSIFPGKLKWNNLGALNATGDKHTITVNFKVKANCDPASNQAKVEGAVDGSGTIGTMTSTVNINIDGPPVAKNDTITCVSASVAINVLANDSDPDNDIASVSILSGPTPLGGTLTVNSDKTIQFNPGTTADNSQVTFKYRVTDSKGLFSEADAIIFYSNFNNSPVLSDLGTLDLSWEKPHVINVLAGSSDPDGSIDFSTLYLKVQPANGVAVVNSNGTVTYTPNAGYEGLDEFTYEVCDNGCPLPAKCATQTVKLNIFSAYYACKEKESTISVPAVPGALTYEWTLPANATITSGANTRTIVVNWSNVAPGSYEVCAKATNDCGESSDECVTVLVGQVSLSATAFDAACFGTATGSIDLTATGGFAPYSYAWSTGASVEDLTNIAAGGPYTVTVTDFKGCTATISRSVSQPSTAVSLTGSVTNENPYGTRNGAIAITVSGGTSPYTYSWTGPGYTSSSEDISGLSGGTYFVTVTDKNGCQITKAFTVDYIGGPLNISSIIATNVKCFGGNDGSIDLEVIGGTTPYSYSWSGPTAIGNTQDPTNLAPGTYSVTVSGGATTATAQVVVSGPTGALSASIAETNVLCSGGNTGALDLSVTGGTAPFSYAWKHGPSVQDLTNLTAGSYEVTVTDANGCNTTQTKTISQTAPIAITGVITDNKCAAANSGAINVSVTGGQTAYSYSWNNGAITEDLSALGTGTYSVLVTDAFGCKAGLSFTVNTVCIGTAKTISAGPVNNGDGTYSLSYSIVVENYGTTTLSDVQITDDLKATFGAPATFVVNNIFCSTLSANSGFNGDGNKNLLSANQSLSEGQSAVIIIDLTVTPKTNLGPYNNSVTASATNGNGVNVSDVSANGTDPDPDNDGPYNNSNPTPITFTETPLIGVAKSITSGPTNNGDGSYTMEFAIKLENYGNVILSGIQAVDNLQAIFGNVPIVINSLSSSKFTVNNSYNGKTNTNLLAGADNLAVGNSGVILLKITVSPSGAGPYGNTVVGSGNSPSGNTVTDNSQNGDNPDPDNNGNPTNNNETTPIIFNEAPSIGVAKQITEGPTNNGDGTYAITYSFIIKNTGDVPLKNIQLQDNLSTVFGAAGFSINAVTTAEFTKNNAYNGNTNVNLLAGTDILNVGQQGIVTLSITITPGANLGPYNNTTTGSGTPPLGTVVSDISHNGDDVDPENDGPGNNNDVTTVTFTEAPVLGLAKNVASITNNNDGTYTVVYSIIAENKGDVVINNIQITDNLAATFAGSTSFSFVSVVSNDFTVNNSYNGTTNVNLLSGAANTIAVEASKTITLTVLVTPGTKLGVYSNSATATGTSPKGTPLTDVSTNGTNSDPDNDGNPGNNNTSTPLTFTESPSLGIAKAVVGSPVYNNDGSFTITYAIKAQNTGDVPLTQLQLEDDLSEAFNNATSFSLVSISSNDFTVNGSFNGTTDLNLLAGTNTLAVGASGRVTIVVKVTPNQTQGTFENEVFGIAKSNSGKTVYDISNDGTDVDPDGDGNPTNNNEPTPVTLPVADLGVTKTISNPAPTAGEVVTFEIGVKNYGPSNASNIVVKDLLPSGYSYVSHTASIGSYNNSNGNWQIATLANGAAETLTISATVLAGDIFASDNYLNIVTVTSTEKDPTPANDTASVRPGLADLAVTKVVDNLTPGVNSEVTFTITATNNGPDNAVGVRVIEKLKSGFEYVSSSASIGDYNPTLGVWYIGNLLKGSTSELTIVAKVLAVGDYNNTAIIEGTQSDLDPLNDTSSIDLNPVALSDLSLTKTVENAFPATLSEVTFTLTAENFGPSIATGVKVTDLLTDGYTYISSFTLTGVYDKNTGIWNIGTLASGSTATLTITALVNTSGNYTNTASITGNETDPDPTNNNPSITPEPFDPTLSADLSINKTADNATPEIGSNIVFTIAVANDGPDKATDVKATDVLSSGYTFLEYTATKGTYEASTGIWNIGELLNTAKDTLWITVKVNETGPYENTASIDGSEDDPDPTNNTSTYTPVPENVIDAIDDNFGPINGSDGGTTASVLNNDLLNGVTFDPTDIVLTTVSSDPELTLNPDGTINVAPNTPAGTYTLIYQICEVINPTNCDQATATVVVDPAVILANDDSFGPINGSDGGTTASVLNNDLLNGVTFDPTDIVLTTVSSDPELTLNPDGTINVAPNTPAGTYTLIYQICEVINPTNCDQATATVVVDPAVILANDDSFGPINGSNGGITASVLANDSLNGVLVDPTLITLTVVSTDPELTLNPDGTITVATNTPAGTYTLTYQICEVLNPTNCDVATATIVVGPAVIDAVDDSFGPIDGGNGGTTASVLANDSLNGVLVDPALITLTVVNSDPELTLNPDGTITVDPNTPAGTYTLTYQICEVINPTNCDQATATVIVDEPVTDLELVKTVNNAAPEVGSQVVFAIAVSNAGPSSATGVTAIDKLKSGYAFVEYTSTKGPYDEITGVWEIGSMLSGSKDTLWITATVNPTGLYDNTASITGLENDPDTTNNTSTTTTTPVEPAPKADLEVLKTIDVSNPVVGTDVTITVSVSNLGPDNATGVNVTEQIPAGYGIKNITVSTGSFDITNSNIWLIGNLNVGESATMSIVAEILAQGPYTTTSQVTGNEFDPILANNYAALTPYVMPKTTAINIPEGFSPNNDGKNDFFVIAGIEEFPENTFVVFNRWGNKVYEAKNYKNDWDGRSIFGITVGNNQLPEGTYFYILDLGQETSSGERVYRGYIYINR
jgi:uncharacterized repeat protein (TIGR01451 family)/gliding motility-associated-like protein